MPPELPQIIANGGINVPQAPRAPEGGAFQPLVGAAENLRFIANEAMRDERAGQAAQAVGNFLLQRDDIQKKLSTVTNPDAYISTHEAALTAAMNDQLKTVAPGPLRELVAGHLKEHMAQTMEQVTSHAVALQVANGRAALENGLNTQAQLAITSPDPKTRDDAMGSALGLIHNDRYTTEDEKALRWTKFEKQVDLGSLQHRIITNDPNVGVELYANDFAAKHPLITPEEQTELQNRNSSQIGARYRLVEAQTKAQIGANEQRLTQMAAQGQDISGELDHLRKFRGVTEDFYEMHTGHPYQETMPGVREAFANAAKSATTPEELNAIEEQSRLAVATGQMSPKDASVVSLVTAHSKAQLKTTGERQKRNELSQLRDAFGFTSKDPFAQYDFSPKVEWGAVEDYFNGQPANTRYKDTLEHFKQFRKDLNGSANPAISRLFGSAPDPLRREVHDYYWSMITRPYERGGGDQPTAAQATREHFKARDAATRAKVEQMLKSQP